MILVMQTLAFTDARISTLLILIRLPKMASDAPVDMSAGPIAAPLARDSLQEDTNNALATSSILGPQATTAPLSAFHLTKPHCHNYLKMQGIKQAWWANGISVALKNSTQSTGALMNTLVFLAVQTPTPMAKPSSATLFGAPRLLKKKNTLPMLSHAKLWRMSTNKRKTPFSSTLLLTQCTRLCRLLQNMTSISIEFQILIGALMPACFLQWTMRLASFF